MIDPMIEELVLPTVAAGFYPRGPGGKKVHVSKVYRDMKQGHRGIFLESVSTPRLATSREAIARFFRRLSEASGPSDPSRTTPASPNQATEAVDRELDRLGF